MPHSDESNRSSLFGRPSVVAVALLAAALGLQLVLSYRSLVAGTVDALPANVLWPYAALGVAVGYAGDLFADDRFGLAFWTGAAVLLGVAYAVEPSLATLLVASIASLAAVYYALEVLPDAGPDVGRR